MTHSNLINLHSPYEQVKSVHQNTRQHEVKDQYKYAFVGADKVFWLPTYLTRENPDLPILTPNELSDNTETKEQTEVVELDDDLAQKLHHLHDNNWLIVLMTAGSADDWLRKRFAE